MRHDLTICHNYEEKKKNVRDDMKERERKKRIYGSKHNNKLEYSNNIK